MVCIRIGLSWLIYAKTFCASGKVIIEGGMGFQSSRDVVRLLDSETDVNWSGTEAK